MNKKEIRQNIRDILAALTDITGFDQDSRKHLDAFHYAVDSIEQLIEDYYVDSPLNGLADEIRAEAQRPKN